MVYLANTFSPAMVAEHCQAVVDSCPLEDVPPDTMSIVSHEVTAKILSTLLGRRVDCNRINVVLQSGDELYCVIPNFRASESREFTRKEIEDSGFRCWYVRIL